MKPRDVALGVFLCLVCWAPCRAQEDERTLAELESWIVLEEEAAPEPPLLRVDVGFVAWIEVRSRIRSDGGALVGTRLDDLEGQQGLDTSGLAPWIELSLGGKVRGGVDASHFVRDGDFTVQEEEVVFDGLVLAEPGDFVKPRFEFLSLSGFVEWDALYGKTYRIGLLAGLRYFRLDIDMRAARSRLQPQITTQRTKGELVSPFFGGLAELNPFPYLTVFTRVEFIIWSWEQLELKEARFLQLRLGTTLNPIPGVLSLGAEFRFLVVRAETEVGRTSGDRFRGAVSSSGFAFTVGLRF